MFFFSNAGEVRCILAQTKQLSLNLHPTHMVKTKKQKTHLEHNMNYMMYLCSVILHESKGGGCATLQ